MMMVKKNYTNKVDMYPFLFPVSKKVHGEKYVEKIKISFLWLGPFKLKQGFKYTFCFVLIFSVILRLWNLEIDI